MMSFQTLQLLFVKHESGSPAGTATLTYTSTSIGKKIARWINQELPWYKNVRLGDLFIEAFYNVGLIDLYYPEIRNGKHVVLATAMWMELKDIPEARKRAAIIGSSIDKPKVITTMMQSWSYRDNSDMQEPVIKEKSAAHNYIIDRNQGKTWLKALDNLQGIGWRVDKRILEAVKRVPEEEPPEDRDDKQRMQRYHSKVIEREFIISKADELSTHDEFYQYLNTDYRGRLYYIEPFFNFQGSDWARGMLKFARGKPMTKDGEFWLAVHTANSYNESYDIKEIPKWCEADYKSHLESEGLESISVDKFTLEDRARWTKERIDLILEDARDLSFYTKAEKPVSFLACCLEWLDYETARSRNTIHMTRLPIPVDGSNNGWQHLGAISKDPKTGDLVGLIPREIQQDFYVQTAKKLKELTTDKRRLSILTSMPMKHIRKGISKRGSMTRAYSAGASKIADNMWLDCRTEGFHDLYGIEEEDCKGFAKDLVKAINAVCPGPLDTMEFLQEVAKYEIGVHGKFLNDEAADKAYAKLRKDIKTRWEKFDKSDADKEEIAGLINELTTYETRLIYGNGVGNIKWETPSGFPVEYEAPQMKSVETISTIKGYDKYNSKSQVKHKGQEPIDAPDMRGYMCGISPNLIHSMDASHMASVIANWNGEFGAVHDSFSTHACDIEKLLDETKKHFVDMYSNGNFYDYIEEQLLTNREGFEIKQPDRGDLDIQEIYESDYFFA